MDDPQFGYITKIEKQTPNIIMHNKLANVGSFFSKCNNN
jgi:hypothetical protein